MSPKKLASSFRLMEPFVFHQSKLRNCRHFLFSRTQVIQQNQFYSSSSQSKAYSKNTRTNINRAEFVDFRISREQAKYELRKWFYHVLAPMEIEQNVKNRSLNAVFIPFWAFDVKVHAKYVGSVGNHHTESHYNSSTKKTETRQRTIWRYNKRGQHQEHFDEMNESMQIYADTKYRRAYVEVVKGDHISKSTALGPRMMLRGTRDIDLFTVRHTTAWERADDFVKKEVEKQAIKRLKSEYWADVANITELDIKYQTKSCRPVYLPAYVFGYISNGVPLRAFVNGYYSFVKGVRQYSKLKVFPISFFATTLLYSLGMNFMNFATPDMFECLTVSTISSIFITYIASAFPFYQLKYREHKRLREHEQVKKVDEEYISSQQWTFFNVTEPDSDGFESGYFYEQKERQRSLYTDPKGYYKKLGLINSKATTTKDIQAAFRRQAMLWHPDHFASDTDERKKEANENFRDILDAYQTLRNPKKRAQYDSSY